MRKESLPTIVQFSIAHARNSSSESQAAVASKINRQAPVVQTSDSAIHRINHYRADSVIDFRNTCPLDSDLSGG